MTSSTFIRDCRHALRALLHSPGFSLVATITFALGIGVNTAVFSVFNGVLLRPLPYPDPDRITMIWMDNRRQAIKEDITSYPTYRDWRAQSTSYAHMAAYSGTAFNLTGAEEPERLQGAQTTASFFDVMGLRPVIGRLYTEAQETPGNDAVVLLSHGLWQRRFGGATDVLGRTITLNGQPHEIIGVMPAALQVPADAELWKPLAPSEGARNARGAFWLPVIGRLKPGVTVEQAQTEMSGIAARLEEAFPANKGFGVETLESQLSETLTSPRFRAVLLASFAIIALLLASIGIYGVTAHAVGQRTHEVGIRMALGAGRGDVLKMIVAQHLAPALIGLAIGLAGALALSRLLRTMVYGVGMTDPITFMSMALALLLVAAAACWIPARRATRVDPLVALRAE